MHGITVRSVFNGQYGAIASEDDMMVEIANSGPATPSSLQRIESRFKSQCIDIREIDNCLSSTSQFITRKPKDSLFLNKVLTIHKKNKEKECSLWSLKGMFNYIDGMISLFDVAVPSDLFATRAPSPGISPLHRRSSTTLSNFHSTSTDNLASCCSETIKKTSSIGNKAGNSMYTSNSSLLQSQPEVNKLYNTFREKSISPLVMADGIAARRRPSYNDLSSFNPHMYNKDNKHSSKTVHPHTKNNKAHHRHSNFPTSHKHHKSVHNAYSFKMQQAGKDEIITAPACTRRLVFRDLRRLDLQFNNLEHEPVLLVRRHCIVLSFYPITAIILADCVLLLVPQKKGTTTGTGGAPQDDVSDAYAVAFEKYMKEWSHENESHKRPNANQTPDPSPQKTEAKDLPPYEFCALEGLLIIIKSYEEQELAAIDSALQDILTYYNQGATPPMKKERKFRALKNHLFNLKKRVSGYKATLIDITEDEEEMAMMNLTFLKKKPQLYSYPLCPEITRMHEEVEDMLESYVLDLVAIEHKIKALETKIKNAEEMYKLHLDTVENRALIGHTALEVLLCTTGFGGYIGGAFGMNLDNDQLIQEIRGGFVVVVALSLFYMSIIFGAIMFLFQYNKMFPRTIVRKYQKNIMRSEGNTFKYIH